MIAIAHGLLPLVPSLQYRLAVSGHLANNNHLQRPSEPLLIAGRFLSEMCCGKSRRGRSNFVNSGLCRERVSGRRVSVAVRNRMSVVEGAATAAVAEIYRDSRHYSAGIGIGNSHAQRPFQRSSRHARLVAAART